MQAAENTAAMLNSSPASCSHDLPADVVFHALLHQDLMSFTEFAFGVVRAEVLFRPNWHLEALTHKLAQVAEGSVRRLIVTIPPRSLKSLCASVALPAWFLGHEPWQRVVVVSYSDHWPAPMPMISALLVTHPTYQATFPEMRLSRETDREIVTNQRGKRIATSIDGTLTGLGGNLIVIDDPLKLGDAMSEAARGYAEKCTISGLAALCLRHRSVKPQRPCLDQRHNKSERRLGCASNNGSIPLETRLRAT